MNPFHPRLLVLLGLTSIILLSGCGRTPPPIIEETTEEPISYVVQDESFDPLSLDEREVIVLPKSKLKPSPEKQGGETPEQKSTPTAALVEMQGYRVQIYVTREEFDARGVEEAALLQFDEGIYLTFDSPNYKIRVGDCVTRAQASQLRDKAVKMGYRDAWVVRSKVMVPTR